MDDAGAGSRPVVAKAVGFGIDEFSGVVYQSPIRSRGRFVYAFCAMALGLGALDAAAADRLKPAHTPDGKVLLTASLDEIGLSAPSFGANLIGLEASPARQWYARMTAARPQSAIAHVFESRFGGNSSPVATASPRGGDGVTVAGRDRLEKTIATAAARHGRPVAREAAAAPVELAYADPSPSASPDAFAALSLPAPEVVEPALDGQMELPSAGPLPAIRPGQAAVAARPDEAEGKAVEKKPVTARPERSTAAALASPPAAGKDKSGFSLRNLFGGAARPGKGVAVYDISAARVYMPDGSVLEAHSGIGEMADDPRYVHVKMNGPTPPHTYNLKMRERRFHGVEAIRMLPVDGRNKHGRDGFLTHSYLLRGRTAQSHGCVAFKDYPKFLNAFKSGKVTQLVVVPSGGRAIARSSRADSNS